MCHYNQQLFTKPSQYKSSNMHRSPTLKNAEESEYILEKIMESCKHALEELFVAKIAIKKIFKIHGYFGNGPLNGTFL